MNRYVFIIIALLFCDVVYSFYQHKGQVLDGDLAPVVLPSKDYTEVLNDPFGVRVLTQGMEYSAPNRYFCHIAMYGYFRTIPLFLQRFVEPIESVYLASALFKTVLQVFLIWLLIQYAKSKEERRYDWLILALLLTPLFQTHGYSGYMGIISGAITYTFFYAFPLALLLLFFLPFFKVGCCDKTIKEVFTPFCLLGLFTLVLILPFSGSLVAPTALLVCGLFFLVSLWLNFKKQTIGSLFNKSMEATKAISWVYWFYFGLLSLLSLYSFYIGTFNAENSDAVSIADRYPLFFKGLFNQLTRKLGIPLLLIFILVNVFILRTLKEKKGAIELLTISKWIGIFSLLYLILLPFGGYRHYRADIIRHDTMMPVTLCLFYFFAASAYFIPRYLKGKKRNIYLLSLLVFSIIFMIADEPEFYNNACEKEALRAIANSPKEVVQLDQDCTILRWEQIKDAQYSKVNGEMLYFWNITSTKKSYQQ